MVYQTDKTDNYLRIIERTRLICNSSIELSELVGSSIVSGNGLHRKGGKNPFMKDAIFRELAYIVNEMTELNLEEVIETYQESSVIFKKIKKIKNKEKICQEIISHYYCDKEFIQELSYLDSIISEHHVPILILLILGLIPCVNEKKGDVKHIDKDYVILLSILKEILCINIPMQVLPAIGRMEDEIIKHPERRSRIHLIYLTNYILNSYGAISNKERISQSIKELETIYPPIEGIWEANVYNTECWIFEEIANGYNLFNYSYSSSKKELDYIKYFVKFFKGEDGIWAIVIHPKSIQYIITNKPIPNKYFSYYHFEIQDNIILFKPFTEKDNCIKYNKLHKSKSDTYWYTLLESSIVGKRDQFESDSYSFEIGLTAITENFIYIRESDNSFYRVPKSINNILEYTKFGDSIGVIRFCDKDKKDRAYIAFDDYSLYYDISTYEKMHKNKIEVVKTINNI